MPSQPIPPVATSFFTTTPPLFLSDKFPQKKLAGKWLTNTPKRIILIRGDILFFLRDPIIFVGIDFDFPGYINTCYGRKKLIFLTHPYKLQCFEILSHNCKRKPNILL